MLSLQAQKAADRDSDESEASEDEMEDEEEEDIEAMLMEEFEEEEEEEEEEDELEEDAVERLKNEIGEVYDDDTNRLSALQVCLFVCLFFHPSYQQCLIIMWIRYLGC